jgi:glycosyltransferase involved in cell wall biosynthesis
MEILMSEKHFTFIVTAYNCEQWIRKCIESIFNQEYTNYEVIIINASSDDHTGDIITKVISEHPEHYNKTIFLTNTHRCYQTENILNGVKFCREDTICVSVDGDDWLPNQFVLNILNEVYTDNVWMTYGSYSHADGSGPPDGHYHRYPPEVISTGSYRIYEKWLSSHLRTWRRSLFLHIKDEDLRYNGTYPEVTGDMFFMYPMLEMAAERQEFVNPVMYIYNTNNPISDGTIRGQEQASLADWIKQRPAYSRLESL